MITQERLKEVLSYDPETGVFTWIAKRLGRCKAGKIANSTYRNTTSGVFYQRIAVDGVRYPSHRLAWFYFYGEFPSHQIDHINGDGTDNRIVNLRAVTHAENQRNKRVYKRNSSGAVGVTRHGEMWRAMIGVNGKNVHIGMYADKDDAVAARKDADHKYGFHENHGRIADYLRVDT